MKMLIDADVPPKVRKPDGHAMVKDRLTAAAPSYPFLSVISTVEVAQGFARLPACE